MFPGGTPGLALLLIRVGVAVSLWLPLLGGSVVPSVWRLLGLATASALLSVGFSTPAISLISCGIQLMRIVDTHRAGLLVSAETATAVVEATFALSLALIGPGAYSIDARLYGRRIVVSS